MNDFFASLETELRRAQRREASSRGLALRLPRPSALVAFAALGAAAAVIAVSVLLPAALRGDRPGEPTKPATACGAAIDAAAEVLAPLRRSRDARDQLPAAARAELERPVPITTQYPLAWPQADGARFARDVGKARWFLVPATVGRCEEAEPQVEAGACAVEVPPRGRADVHCTTLSHIKAGIAVTQSFTAERTTEVWILADGARPFRRVGKRVFRPQGKGNLFVVEYAGRPRPPEIDLAGTRTATTVVHRPARQPERCSSAGRVTQGRLVLCARRLNSRGAGRFLVRRAGTARALAVGRPMWQAPKAPFIGSWQWAAASPDGQTILAQWSGECEIPHAFFVAASGGKPRSVTGKFSRNSTPPNSTALGWSDDGRAIVFMPLEPACGGTETSGVFLIDVAGRKTLIAEVSARAPLELKRSLRPRSIDAIKRVLSR